MADSRSNYSLTTFNSSGELVQISTRCRGAERRDVFGHPRGQRRGSCHRKEASLDACNETTVEKIMQLTPEIAEQRDGAGLQGADEEDLQGDAGVYRPYHELCPARKSR